MDDVVVCLVRGPASRYPRGYLWFLPAWFLVLSGATAIVGMRLDGHLPLWLGASEIGGLLIAMWTAVCVLLTARRVAFRADDTGILLGARTIRRRPKRRRVYLPWSEVAQVTLVPPGTACSRISFSAPLRCGCRHPADARRPQCFAARCSCPSPSVAAGLPSRCLGSGRPATASESAR